MMDSDGDVKAMVMSHDADDADADDADADADANDGCLWCWPRLQRVRVKGARGGCKNQA